MKKQFIGAVLAVLFLAALIPLASHSPDGLETVAEMLGARSKDSSWTPAASFTAAITGNWYLSTFLEGLFGILAVLLAGFLLERTMKPNKNARRA